MLDKFDRLLDKAGIDKIDFKNKLTAIKLHFGEPGNLGFIRPNYVKRVVKKISESFDPEYYFYEKPIKKGVYESEVMVKKKFGELVPLSEFSEYIKNVISLPIFAHYYIGPKEIMAQFKK